MAEVLGLAANVAAVLQLASQVAQLSYKYARDVKNAPRTQKQYLQEVSALMEVLFRVEEAVQDAESTDLLPNRPSALSADSVMDCYKALSDLYFDLQKRRPRFLQPFHEREWRDHIDILTKYRSLFTDFLSSCVLATGTATYNKVTFLNKEQDRSLLLTWLPAPNLPARRRPSPCPGTGGWFLEEDSVQKWIEKTLNFVWCYGAPGVGKSFLASRVIDHLLDARVSQDSLVISFFCDFTSPDEQNAIDILHHILRQIIEQGNAEILTILKESCKDPSKLQRTTEVAELIASAGLAKPMYLILDAVDELKDPIPLLSEIKPLVSAGINVLITSRDLPHIRKNMARARMLKVKSNPKDLKLYIESRLRDSDFSEEIDEGGRLVGDILSNSGNLFLLSRLTLDNVLDFTTINQIRKALRNHHASLHQAFKATIGRIESQSKARSSLAHRLLRWMTQAKRRLRLQEILCAFSVEDEELDPDNKPHPDILLRVCHGLVVVDDVDDTVGLVHTTAYEFLKSIKDLGQEGGLDIARTSLQYLTMKHTSNPCATSREMLRQLQSLEFFEYSAKYWGHHISMPDQERQLEGLITKLLSDDRKRNSAFQALQYQLEFAGSSSGEDVLQSMPKDLGALHVAAYWGLAHTARIFLAKGESVCGLDSHKWTPLHWACCQSHADVVELLVAVGADVNAQDIQGWTPLFWAAFEGDAELVRLLLSHGANHLLRSTLGWTALHWAVSSGHSETVKIFLEHHARAETQEPVLSKMSIQSVVAYAEGILPVQVAAEGQDLEIFNLLVQHLETPGGVIGDAKFNMIWATAKFDSPASNNPWRTLTKGDKVNGRESTLPRLTGSYADKSEQYRTDPTEWKTVLLVSAVRDGQLSSVQLLAKAGANVNSALYAAACRRDPSYVRCLLEHGADPNKPSYGHFALHEAVLNGFLETTAALIDGGADANNAVPPGNSDGRFGRRRRYGRGPTMRAAHRLLTRIIPLGKNVHYALVQFAGATPLIQACGFLFGSKSPDLSLEMALLLLSYGADPGLKDASGMTALHYAAMRPHLPLIKLLVSSGCPVDVRDEKGRLPIHCLGNITGSLSDKTREYQIDTSHMPEVIRIILDVAHCSAFPHMLEVPVHRGPTAVDDDRTVQSGQEVEGLTPMGIALATKQWEIVVIFHALGAQIPHNMDLGPIVAAAIADLAVDAVGILLDNGAHIATDAIHTLLGALLARRSDGEAVDDALYPRFKRLLGTIVAAGAEVDSQSADGDTALVVAARIPGNVNVIKDLANIGADVFAFSGLSFDPILTAAVYGDIECLSYLLDQAAAHPNENHWSNFSGELGEIILDPLTRLCLYLKSADDLNRTNKQGRTLLHLATERGNVPLIRSLLACGAQPDITDERGWYAVHDAGAILNAAAVQALLPRDTSTEETDIQTDRDKSFWLEIVAQPIEYPECYRNPLNIFQLAIIRGNIQIAQYLLEYGVYPNTCLSEFYDNEPVLYHAAKSGRCELVQLLLAHGASIETTDTFGWSPLHAACYFGHADIAKVLIEAGSDVHAETAKWNNNNVKPSGLYSGDNYRSQPLHLATMAGNADIVKILLDNGVDIYAQTECKDSWCRNSHGPTALHLALDTATFYGRNGEPLDEGRLRIAEWMVERGLMVQGVIPRFGLEQILMFKAFPDLWDALRAGEMEAGE